MRGTSFNAIIYQKVEKNFRAPLINDFMSIIILYGVMNNYLME